MALTQLDNPVRVTWDLCSDSNRMADSAVDIVLPRLLEAHPFFVALEQSPLEHSRCADILSRLAETGIQTTLFCQGQEGELENLDAAEGFDLSVFVRLEPFLLDAQPDISRLSAVVETLRGAGHDPGFCLTPLKSNLHFLPTLFELGKVLKVPCFKLPNVRIDANFQQSGADQVLRPEDLEKIRYLLPEMRSALSSLNLQIHDLFLWELLCPDSNESRSEYGGCQAGNTLAHINYDGTVYPCVSWPKSLGSLLDSPFSDIWASDSCREVRRSIATKPVGCSGCSDYQICFGGCRGLSATFDTEDGLDPMCSGSR